MRLSLDCIPCLQRQALQTLGFAACDAKANEKQLRLVLRRLADLDWTSPPPEAARQIQTLVREESGNPDPYLPVKRASNEEALLLYPRMKRIVESSEDPLITAARMAIAGNIIDFGSFHEYDLEDTIARALHSTFALDDSDRFKSDAVESSSLLYFLDNAGEIVFDRLFIEALGDLSPIKMLDLVVKGGPMINDAMLEDARMVGLEDVAGASLLTVDNGDPGTGPSLSSREVKSWITNHDLVISKGQANYEEMGEYPDVYFLFIAKCPVVARHVRVDVGDLVFHRSG